MKYHDQTILSDPETGAVGDCLRAIEDATFFVPFDMTRGDWR